MSKALGLGGLQRAERRGGLRRDARCRASSSRRGRGSGGGSRPGGGGGGGGGGGPGSPAAGTREAGILASCRGASAPSRRPAGPSAPRHPGTQAPRPWPGLASPPPPRPRRPLLLPGSSRPSAGGGSEETQEEDAAAAAAAAAAAGPRAPAGREASLTRETRPGQEEQREMGRVIERGDALTDYPLLLCSRPLGWALQLGGSWPSLCRYPLLLRRRALSRSYCVCTSLD
ncbi:translation initiation factor IF-2-like [Canis lupus dingo]|uniref:translation initiation factor IF-2-like n=1 Tax=Canis lupus dingo TaxID=286419 RepID=UPI0020C404D3|nr:translation initiation factor IF-2-like [Canis lupus dingo]